MDRIGVIICNYNKKDYVINCIKSLQEQNYKDFDIYVVDNASTDNSCEAVEREFGNSVVLIKNTENLGGSGGFNTGIRKAMEKNYEYLMLLDNDVVLDKECINKLYLSMNQYPEIGIQGCIILKMDYPDVIQEFGPIVNYETMTFELRHGGEKISIDLPEIVDCDYVPACALMIRREVIEKIGLMPEENFIYYDDIEWGIRCHRAGYRVVANSNAKAWHKGGAAINPTTFGSYYINRNKYRFFMKYMQTEKTDASIEMVEERAEKILSDMFQGLYSCNYNGLEEMVKTRMEAFLDALNDKTGRAAEYKIRKKQSVQDKLGEIIEGKNNVLICMNGYIENTRKIVLRLQEENKKGKNIAVSLVNEDAVDIECLLGCKIENCLPNNLEQYDLVLHMCKHIYLLDITEFNKIWVDGWGNIIADEKDARAQMMYNDVYQLFNKSFKDSVINVIKNNLQKE